ncbi:hypothetical protein GCM10011519_04960 [Marmoricola endophyticus]|uniref:Dimethyladenosine transferase n=1 Tax=Marmoricola endophyticus TaxID=2040280 RepID=A0A917BE92_9ACTN|nr:SRPBCC family protein [Marmoricola endophyticus]GGF34493.1 hypothetical protein GCM10011519_04960 [Marmoricola endophyticus]
MSTPQVSTVDAGPRKVSRSIEVGAPAHELFAMVADPRRHGELDGSGTVGDAKVSAPERLSQGATFSVAMKMFGVPYAITSTVTELVEDRVVEWRHPAGHRWRWELEEVSPTRTRVTETFDYSRSAGSAIAARLGMAKANARGITATLQQLATRYDAG